MSNKKVILITGAAMGIGRAAACKFARNDWSVAMIDREKEALMAVSEDLKKEGRDVEPFLCDVSDYEQCNDTVEKVVAHYRKIDALYNNAGVLGDRLGILDFDHKAFQEAFQTNVFGSMYMIQLVSRTMVERKLEGCIINTTSINADIATWDPVGYIGSKGAMRCLTRTCAFQLGKYKIRVNAVSPGATVTPMARASWENKEVYDTVAGLHIRNMWIQPEMVADAAFFLASEEAYGINGVILPVDDGYTCGKSADFSKIS
ncbi:SDR family NAD(P)-dependent oxidoreductase [Bariatricus sp. SGI.154]|uniref:SDR family NAD(P)-dependent oxidoreductase n=1 Tax=Bariatricus sp. SGI.154 TaxID=3420549 RepID=UPI003CFFF311